MADVAYDETLSQSTERSIELLFASYLAPGQAERKALTELDIRQVSDGLRRMGKDSWSKVPRLYTVLRLVNQLQVIDSFVAQGITDIWFPFSLKTLPDTLRSPSSRFEFIEAQPLVLTKAFDLEREDGRHRHFSKADDVPMRKIEELGKGGFGYVDRVVSTITYKEYARKLIPRGRTFKKNLEVLKDFERELGHLKKLSHIHIVELIGSYTDPKYVGIIMSPVAEYNLKEFLALEPLPPGSVSFLRTFFGCLAAALSYLHNHQIRHKDIKPQNVLVKGHQVFLTDFGISLDWSELGQSTTTGVTLKTPRYCAPEVAQYMPRNSFSDMWSLGCVFLEIWTVLKGKRIVALLDYLDSHGSKSTCYYLNRDAAMAWCGTLEAELAPEENPPLPWIFGMLQPDQNERWTAQKLLDEIQEVNENPETRFIFSGLCCVNDDDSTGSAKSSQRSSRNVEETGTSNIGVYYTSRPATQDIADDHPPAKKLSSLKNVHPSAPMRLSLESPDPGPTPLQPVNDPGLSSVATDPAQAFQPTDELDAPQVTSVSMDLSKPVEVTDGDIIKSEEQVQRNQDASVASRLPQEKTAPEVADGDSRERLYPGEDTSLVSGLHAEDNPSKFIAYTAAEKSAMGLKALSPVSRDETKKDESQFVADVATRERVSADGRECSKDATSATKASLHVANTPDQDETWVNFLEHQFNIPVEKASSSSGSLIRSTDDETTLRPLRKAEITPTGLKPAIPYPAVSSSHKRDLVSWWRQLPKEDDSILIPAPAPEPESEPGLIQSFKSRNEELRDPDQMALKNSSAVQAGAPAQSHVLRELNEKGISNAFSPEPAGKPSQKASKADDTPRQALAHALSERSSTDLLPFVAGFNVAKTQQVLPLQDSGSAAGTNLAVNLTKPAEGALDMKITCSACYKRCKGQYLRALGGTYHLNCFRCEDCGVTLADKFFPVDEEKSKRQYPLCETDYFRRLDLLCYDCGGALRGSYITALDDKYHEEHFHCRRCDTVFGVSDSYYQHGRDVLCRYHYTLIATKCKGCDGAILGQFVEIFRSGEHQQWHPDCYMISKYWDVTVASENFRHGGDMVLVNISNPSKDERTALYATEDRMRNQIYRIWDVLSKFEQRAANYVSDMLLYGATGVYLDALISAEKTIFCVRILFLAIEGQDEMTRETTSKGTLCEAERLCKKVVAFFTLLSTNLHSQEESKPGEPRATDEILSIAYDIGNSLKVMIRIGLRISLRRGSEAGSQEALSGFLDMIEIADADVARPGISAGPEPDLCQTCRQHIKGPCIRCEGRSWHAQCLICTVCGINLSDDLSAARLQKSVDGHELDASLHCAKHSIALSSDLAGFKKVSCLEQFSFLVMVELVRFATIIDKWNAPAPVSLSGKRYPPFGSALALLAQGPFAAKEIEIAVSDMMEDTELCTQPEFVQDSWGQLRVKSEGYKDRSSLDDIPRGTTSVSINDHRKDIHYTSSQLESAILKRKPIGADSSSNKTSAYSVHRSTAPSSLSPPPEDVTVRPINQQGFSLRQAARGLFSKKS